MSRPIRLAAFFLLALLLLPAAHLSGQSCGPWRWINPLPQGNTLSGVAFGGGRYVAVGRAGTILVSDDGVAWSMRASNLPHDLADVAWNGNEFLVAGASGTILVSSDRGESWAFRINGAAENLVRAAWNGSRWVVAGDAGSLLTSTDANAWQPAAAFEGTSWYDLAWNGQEFLAVGREGASASSRRRSPVDCGPVGHARPPFRGGVGLGAVARRRNGLPLQPDHLRKCERSLLERTEDPADLGAPPAVLDGLSVDRCGRVRGSRRERGRARLAGARVRHRARPARSRGRRFRVRGRRPAWNDSPELRQRALGAADAGAALGRVGRREERLDIRRGGIPRGSSPRGRRGRRAVDPPRLRDRALAPRSRLERPVVRRRGRSRDHPHERGRRVVGGAELGIDGDADVDPLGRLAIRRRGQRLGADDELRRDGLELPQDRAEQAA